MTCERTSARRIVVLLAVGAGLASVFVSGSCLAADGAGAARPLADIPAAAAAPEPNVLFHVLLSLAAVIALGRCLAWACRGVGQPAVIGEVLAGLLLGPSVLGAIWPAGMHALIPDAATDPGRHVLQALQTVSQLGVLLYMFLVGLDLDPRSLARHARSAVAISLASIVVPLGLGIGLAAWLYPRLAPAGVPLLSFALFMGVAMAITAFPVLARILTDRGLERSPLGIVALGCAATDDVCAWCLLALVVGVVRSDIGSAALVGMSAVALVGAMLLIVRPLMTHWAARYEHSARRIPWAWLFALVLLAAVAAESAGVHAIFGGFLLGAVIPHDSRFARELRSGLRDVATALLLPAFFAVTGMQTQIRLVSGTENIAICAAILLVATLGKFGGSYAAARATGIDHRTAAALGVLMNTRGLMELIVLNVGLSLGVISPTLFAMMVLMALATTMATSPVLGLLVPAGLLRDPQPRFPDGPMGAPPITTLPVHPAEPVHHPGHPSHGITAGHT